MNVFVEVARADQVLQILETLGAEPISPEERVRLQRDDQARVQRELTPVDLFFSYDAPHASCLERRRVYPFGDDATVHVLSMEDLMIFKALFDRSKDWRDIEEVVCAMAGEFDASYVRQWLERIVGRHDARYRRLDEPMARST